MLISQLTEGSPERLDPVRAINYIGTPGRNFIVNMDGITVLYVWSVKARHGYDIPSYRVQLFRRMLGRRRGIQSGKWNSGRLMDLLVLLQKHAYATHANLRMILDADHGQFDLPDDHP